MSVMVTVAPGTTAPLRSVTVPAIPPLLVWATATVQKREAATAASGRRVLIRVSAGAGRRRSSYPYCLYASLFVRISKWEDKIHTWPAALFLDAERYGKGHSGTLLFCLSDLVASAARWHVQDSHRRRFRSQKRRGNFVRVALTVQPYGPAILTLRGHARTMHPYPSSVWNCSRRGTNPEGRMHVACSCSSAQRRRTPLRILRSDRRSACLAPGRWPGPEGRLAAAPPRCASRRGARGRPARGSARSVQSAQERSRARGHLHGRSR